MAGYGKPNATGRSTGKLTAAEKKIIGPPKGEPWAWLTTELLASPAWRMRSINTVRLIDFLLIEHRNHAGGENGNLLATYDQLTDYGLSRRWIKAAILEAVFLGLVKVTHEGGMYAGNNQPSTYRLTFYASRDGSPATNEWKGKTAEAIKEWKRDQTMLKKQKKEQKARRKKTIPGSHLRTTVVQLCELRNAKKDKRP